MAATFVPSADARWDQLYEEFASARALEVRQLESAAAALDQRREFEEWTRFAVRKVMNEWIEQARARAADLLRRHNVAISVGTLESHGDPSLSRGQETLQVSLEQAEAEVFVFATRMRDAPPYIHLGFYAGGLVPARPLARRLFMTLPGVGLIRTQSGGISLRDARDAGRLGPEASLDELVFRAFQTLCRQVTSKCDARLRNVTWGTATTRLP